MPSPIGTPIYLKRINKIIAAIIKRLNPHEVIAAETPANYLTFMDNQVPSIKSGQYTIDASQALSLTGGGFTPIEIAITQKIYVDGPRFQLDPTDILSVFPPGGSTGDHAYVLPHIVLKRATIPWEIERSNFELIDGKDTPSAKYPWLVLLLFDASELPEVKTETLLELSLNNDYNETTQQVNTIEVPESLLQKLLQPADLQNLTHVRQKSHGPKSTDLTLLAERAIVVGNRLPKADSTSTVHLVSLANFPMAKSAGNVKLISLHQWTFTCPALRCTETPATKASVKKGIGKDVNVDAAVTDGVVDTTKLIDELNAELRLQKTDPITKPWQFAIHIMQGASTSGADCPERRKKLVGNPLKIL